MTEIILFGTPAALTSFSIQSSLLPPPHTAFWRDWPALISVIACHEYFCLLISSNVCVALLHAGSMFYAKPVIPVHNGISEY